MKSQKEQKFACPFCGGDRLHKDGFAYMKEGKVQQYQCNNKNCRRRTIKPVRMSEK